MSNTEHLVAQAVKIAGIDDYTGEHQSLGGGVVNDTYLLHCTDRKLILRITRWEGRDTLLKEAKALQLLHFSEAPQLVFFDKDQLLDGHYWIIETHLPGTTPKRLSLPQFENLGRLLAEVHQIGDDAAQLQEPWQALMTNCRNFGMESELLNHEDPEIKELLARGKEYIARHAGLFDGVVPRLLHRDVTHSNMLVEGDQVSLIDWEFSLFGDPMCDFSTIYYEDMDYNQGKWRIHIDPEEIEALFTGYEAAGGKIDQARIDFWMNHDKLGAMVFLYWRIHKHHEPLTDEQIQQFTQDLAALKKSLQTNM